jgi:hypothetical protein
LQGHQWVEQRCPQLPAYFHFHHHLHHQYPQWMTDNYRRRHHLRKKHAIQLLKMRLLCRRYRHQFDLRYLRPHPRQRHSRCHRQ